MSWPRVPRSAREAFEPYVPGAGCPWELGHAGHLLRRAGFGGTREELDTVLALGPEAASRALTEAEPDARLEELDDALSLVLDGGDPRRLRAWWIFRMIRTRDPFREKLALFLHGHFAAAHRKVRSARWMAEQVRTYLDQGKGPFGATAASVVKGPAMLVYLDAASSHRRRPNENLARELLELFTVGRGDYSEADVKEAARALTGWRVEANGARFDPSGFDDGAKVVFGVKGNFGVDELVALCVDRPACALLLARKLLCAFALPDPPPPLVDAFARILRERGLALGEALGVLFASRLFYSQACRRALVKSPVEYVVGTARALEVSLSGEALVAALDEMGQSLFDPPSVKGWEGGRAWLQAAAWLARARFAFEATRDGDRVRRFLEVQAGRRGAVDGTEGAVEALLDGDLPDRSRAHLRSWAEAGGGGAEVERAIVQSILLTPEFHCN